MPFLRWTFMLFAVGGVLQNAPTAKL